MKSESEPVGVEGFPHPQLRFRIPASNPGHPLAALNRAERVHHSAKGDPVSTNFPGGASQPSCLGTHAVLMTCSVDARSKTDHLGAVD